jgi:hypothetical protein
VDDVTAARQVRQIAQFPRVETGALPDDLLLLQRYGLGGPYISLTAAEFLATALGNAPGDGIGLTYGAAIGWARDWPAGQPGAGPAFHLSAAAPAGFTMDAPLTVTGGVTVNGTINALAVASGGMAVATVNYVTENTAASFMGRTGHIGLTPTDILLGGGVTAVDARMQGTCLAPTQWNPNQADDTIATCAFVQNALCSFFESWLNLQTPVLSWNGRGGNVTLTLADVNAANMSVSGQYPQAPTPPTNDNSTDIATTAYVVAAASAAIAAYGVRFPTVAPVGPVNGSAWWAGGSRTLFIYDGTTWRSVVLT